MNWNKEIISRRTTNIGVFVLWLVTFPMIAGLTFLEFRDMRFGRAGFLSLITLTWLFLGRGLLIRVVYSSKSPLWRPIGRFPERRNSRANRVAGGS
ncbi:MAG: hypothetical protein IPL39_02450 [Opitutaceae bacterium]|nr:hypothetical protein [Opitutaceae bacterium]